MIDQNSVIGYLVGGGLKESFRVRLTVDPLTVQEGAFVVIESGTFSSTAWSRICSSVRLIRALQMNSPRRACRLRWRRLCMARHCTQISKCCRR